MSNDASIEKISEILKNKDFGQFMGMSENPYFEAKIKPYNIENLNDRVELLKDVDAFLNYEGGYIIIGLGTDPNSEKIGAGKVDEIVPLTEDDFKKDAHFSAIKQGIHPTAKIVVDWVERIEKDGYGLGCIYVPKQNESEKPFLIKEVIEDGKKITEIVFGISQRIGAKNQPLSIKELHNYLKKGKITTAKLDIENRLDSLDSKVGMILERLSSDGKPLTTPADKLLDRMKELE